MSNCVGLTPDDYEESILRSLRRIVRAIDLHSRFLESEYGLTGPQLVCLRAIDRHGPMSPTELARQVDLSQGTVTGIVDRLVRRQYVSRRRTSKDRRRVVLSSLPAGRDLLASAPSPLQARFASRLEQLPVENRGVIAMMLEQIVRMMGADDLEAAAMLAAGDATAPAGPPSEGRHGGVEPEAEAARAANSGDTAVGSDGESA